MSSDKSLVIFNAKKGISPLIATVLLIAFAVSLGAVIMNWSLGFIQENVSDGEDVCSSDVRMRIVELNDKEQLCYGGEGTDGYIYFAVENTGSKNISSVYLRVYGSSDSQIDTALEATNMIAGIGDTRKNVTYSYAEHGDIKKIILTPVVKEAETKVCSESSIEVDISEISHCSTI